MDGGAVAAVVVVVLLVVVVVVVVVGGWGGGKNGITKRHHPISWGVRSITNGHKIDLNINKPANYKKIKIKNNNNGRVVSSRDIIRSPEEYNLEITSGH